jgi:nicotinamidase-related amidase
LPNVAAALAATRGENALVIYSVHPAPDNNIMPDVGPMPDHPVFVAIPGDKFYNSDLANILKQSGITTLVSSGVSSNIGVLYTAGTAAQRSHGRRR